MPQPGYLATVVAASRHHHHLQPHHHEPEHRYLSPVVETPVAPPPPTRVMTPPSYGRPTVPYMPTPVVISTQPDYYYSRPDDYQPPRPRKEKIFCGCW